MAYGASQRDFVLIGYLEVCRPASRWRCCVGGLAQISGRMCSPSLPALPPVRERELRPWGGVTPSVAAEGSISPALEPLGRTPGNAVSTMAKEVVRLHRVCSPIAVNHRGQAKTHPGLLRNLK